MSLRDLYSLMTSDAIKDSLSVGGIVLVIIMSLLQVSKVNVNPWDSLLAWLGTKINKKLNERLSEIDGKVTNVQTALNAHIAESEEKELQVVRRDILDFANSCMTGRKHTKEQFDFIISECDSYEKYIEDNNIKNGVVTSAIKEIKRLNEKCIQENSFLKEREYE